jgi:hypothetical protein
MGPRRFQAMTAPAGRIRHRVHRGERRRRRRAAEEASDITTGAPQDHGPASARDCRPTEEMRATLDVAIGKSVSITATARATLAGLVAAALPVAAILVPVVLLSRSRGRRIFCLKLLTLLDYHAHGWSNWLAHVTISAAVHALIYGSVFRLMHHLTPAQAAVLVAVVLGCLFMEQGVGRPARMVITGQLSTLTLAPELLTKADALAARMGQSGAAAINLAILRLIEAED